MVGGTDGIGVVLGTVFVGGTDYHTQYSKHYQGRSPLNLRLLAFHHPASLVQLCKELQCIL